MTRTRTSSKTLYTPAARGLLASLTPHASMLMLRWAQAVLRANGTESNVPLSRLLTDDQRRAHRNLKRRESRERRARVVA